MNNQFERNETNAKTEMLIGFCHGASRASLDEKTSDTFNYIRNQIVEIYHLINKIEKTFDENFLNTNVKDEFTIRISNALISANINTLSDLIMMSAHQLIKIPNFGKKSLKEVECYLNSRNLSLKGQL